MKALEWMDARIAGAGGVPPGAGRQARGLALGALAAAVLSLPAAAQDEPRADLEEAVEKAELVEKGSLSVGAGSTAYIDEESPGTAFTLDGRYNYAVAPMLDLEGSLQASFSQAVGDDQAVLPLLAEAGVKVNTRQYGPVNLFGAAGVGYGAFLGSEELQDGATMTLPIGGGIEYELGALTLQPRFTWRPVVGDEVGAEGADGDSWTALLDVELPFL